MTTEVPRLSFRRGRLSDTATRYQLTFGRSDETWSGLRHQLQHSEESRRLLTTLLAESPFRAFFWECAPLAPGAQTPAAFVLVDSPALARVTPDPGPFAEHLAGGDGRPGVRAFDSLRGDARLVAPCPCGDTAYPHLAAFVRGAPEAQTHALWQAVGVEIDRWIADDRGPLWVSTSGLGVHWLHVRLDSRPKYYTHAPYRQAPEPAPTPEEPPDRTLRGRLFKR